MTVQSEALPQTRAVAAVDIGDPGPTRLRRTVQLLRRRTAYLLPKLSGGAVFRCAVLVASSAAVGATAAALDLSTRYVLAVVALGWAALLVGYRIESAARTADITRKRILTLSVLALLAVSTVSFAIVSHVQYTVADQRAAEVRHNVAEQTGKLTAGVLTYKADTVDADVQQAKTHLTGEFLTSYSTLTADTIIPQAKQGHVEARWEVSGTSVVSAAPDSAVVLVFLRGITTNRAKPDPTYLVSSVRVLVEKPHDQWLIAKMEPL